jgi:fimbrial isopeptide formation D2 family protein
MSGVTGKNITVMKKFNLLLLSAMGFLANTAFGQVVSYTPMQYSDSTQGCITSIYLQGQIGANPETGGIITVDWGDSNIETVNFTTTSGQTMFWETVDHGYAVAGTYTVNVSVFSGTSGANVDAGQSLTVTAYDPANCGYIYLTTSQQSPWVGYSGVPMDFTGADGITTTVVPSQINPNFDYFYTGLNLANAPYNVSISDAWLALNGLVQTTPDITITGFQPSGGATPIDGIFNVECAVAAADPDFGVYYGYGWGFVAPLETGNAAFNICNYACNNTDDASVTLTFPSGLVPTTTGLTNPVVTATSLTFDIQALADCEQISIPFTFPGTTPAGTLIPFTLVVNNPDDTDNTNNEVQFDAMVMNSYDPNAKEVNQQTQLNPNVQEELTYIIHFQNDGNFNALDVVVTDEIDMNLDLSTLQVAGSKHAVATSVNPSTRMVTFSFNDINLMPSDQDLEGSQGYVVYKIKENAGLPLNSTIENTANIYFDFNPAIVTNTTYNINQSLGMDEPGMETISMFPNPANDLIRFNGAAVDAVQIYDMAGKQLLSTSAVVNNELSVASLANGIYQIVISTPNGVQTQKLAIRK